MEKPGYVLLGKRRKKLQCALWKVRHTTIQRWKRYGPVRTADLKTGFPVWKSKGHRRRARFFARGIFIVPLQNQVKRPVKWTMSQSKIFKTGLVQTFNRHFLRSGQIFYFRSLYHSLKANWVGLEISLIHLSESREQGRKWFAMLFSGFFRHIGGIGIRTIRV